MAVSEAFRESAYAADTEAVWLVLLTISHEELTDDIRVVNDNLDLVSRGQTFLACPFEPVLPTDTDEGPPTARLRVDNVSQDLTIALREVSSGVSVKMEVVAADRPDDVEATFDGFKLSDVSITNTAVTGTLGLDDLRLERFPAHSFTPGSFPGIFQ